MWSADWASHAALRQAQGVPVIDCCTSKCHYFSDIAMWGLWRCRRNRILILKAPYWSDPSSFGQSDIFFTVAAAQMKTWNRLDRLCFLCFFFNKMSKCWDKFTLKCAPAALLLFLDSITAWDAGAVCLVFACVRVCLCVFLMLYFDKLRRETCKRRLLNSPQCQESERETENQKDYIFMLCFEDECLYTVCVSIFIWST